MPCLLCLLVQVSSPMDLATILSRVDAQQYSTPQEYLADFGLIVQVGTVGRDCSVCASPICGLCLGRFHSWSIPVSPASSAHPLPIPCPLPSLLQCSREYWGTNPAGVREISRACALEDEARAAVASAVPPELQARLEELVAQGGPAPAPPSESCG